MDALINIGYIAMIFLVFTYGFEVWGLGRKSPKEMHRIDWLQLTCTVPVITSIIITWLTEAQTMLLFVLWFILINMPAIMVFSLAYYRQKPVKVAERMTWWFTTPGKN